MNFIFKNPAVYAILAYCLLFISSIFVIGATPVKDFIDYAVLSVALYFLFKWLPNAWEAFKSGGNERKFRLSLGLVLMAAGLVGQRIWIIIVNQVGIEDWVSRDAVSAFIGSWFVGSLLLKLSIDTPEEGLIPQLKVYYTTIAIGFGAVLGFLVARIFS